MTKELDDLLEINGSATSGPNSEVAGTQCDDKRRLLKQHEGSKCPKCELAFFGKVDKCEQCGGPTVRTKWYTRLCVERIAFIATAAVVGGIAASLSGADGANFVAGFFGTALVVFSVYFTANYFLGIGGFTERFAGEALPERARRAFSWGRYFSEIFRIVGVFLALSLVIGLAMLIRWAFTVQVGR